MEDSKSIIIDNGTGYIKAGLSEEEEPQLIIPNCFGIPKTSDSSFNKKKYFYGEEIEKMRDKLILKYPVSRGMVTDWDMMEKIFDYIFNRLTGYPEDYNIMLTEPVINPKDQREKMISIMFETFNVQKFYITEPGKLVLYNNGGFTGMVLDSGEGVTQFIPIVDGYGLHFTNLIEFGGKDLTEYMVRLLNEIKYIPIEKEKEIAKNAKEKACYVSLDYKEDLHWVDYFDYKLPDGTNIYIKEQRIKCCEALFEPSMAGVDYDDNIAQYCNNCIKKCNEFAQKQLYSNIILSGGNTMFEGFQERLTKEIKALAPYIYKEDVNVIANTDRKLAVWKGGRILANLSDFEEKWITKTEYEESGATIVHRKTN